MSRIEKKIYVRLVFRLMSPLALSSGENANSDKDAVRDSLGRPYIPASSIAGVCTGIIKKKMDEQSFEKYFGFVHEKDEDEKEREKEREKEKKDEEDRPLSSSSRIFFYDAAIEDKDPKQTYRIVLRDGVGLNEKKTAVRGAKFDMEAVEPGPEGLHFVTFLTQDLYQGDQDLTWQIVNLFRSSQLSFGGKTMRGYGLTELASCGRREFSLTDPAGVQKWLKFDMYDKGARWDPCGTAGTGESSEKNRHDLYSCLHLELCPRGAVMIRKYTSRPSEVKNDPEPDYEQLTISGNIPVIPGTGWAGAFRHRMADLGLTEDEIKDLFGSIRGREGYRSRIKFSETQLKGAEDKKLSRNAIDRFTGGAASGALYTERTFYGGRGSLDITFTRKLTERESATLAAAVADLHGGFLAVGGLTSVGRGLFRIVKINNKDIPSDQKPEDVYRIIKKALPAELGKEDSIK